MAKPVPVASADEVLEKIRKLRVWSQGDRRAPHKPLLILYVLGQIQKGHGRIFTFAEVEKPLSQLIKAFGPSRSVHPEYPFFHLESDSIWEIIWLRKPPSGKGVSPTRKMLTEKTAGGGFHEPIFNLLKSRPDLIRTIAQELLEAHFPESLHEDVLAAVGLDISTPVQGKRRRDSAFRAEVIRAYQHRCSFCGYSVRLDDTDLALEAAHIKWVQASGPDIVPNGLACCTLHHKAFDYGAIGLTDDLRILISGHVYGNEFAEQLFIRLAGLPLHLPGRREELPDRRFIRWHQREVFKGPALDR